MGPSESIHEFPLRCSLCSLYSEEPSWRGFDHSLTARITLIFLPGYHFTAVSQGIGVQRTARPSLV
jgi:hypothetical protein